MLSRALEGFSSYLAALLELSFWFVITFSPWQYWISYSFYMLSFWCYCSLFFSAVASASDDCYSNPLWFLQLWQRGQRIHSAFHQIYTGQCTLFFFFSLLGFNFNFISMSVCPNSSCSYNVTSCIGAILYHTSCRIWLFLGLYCSSLGWRTPFLKGNPRRLQRQKLISRQHWRMSFARSVSGCFLVHYIYTLSSICQDLA